MQQIIDRAGVSLRDSLPNCRIIGGDDVRVRSCTSDWRSCQPGDLFVAIDDGDRDGHFDVDRAIERGAAAVMTERLVPVSVPNCIVPDTREAYGHLCQAMFGHPSDHLRMIGITGTHGKTTASILLASVLEHAGQRVGVLNSILYSDAVDSTPAATTTPPATELARWLARMNANGCNAGIVEVSSRALAERRTAGVLFDAAILTNIRRDHLDHHGSLLNYRKAKGRLFSQLKEHGYVVINADDPCSRAFLSKLENPVITVGMHSDAEITATVVERCRSEQTFLLMAGNETVAVRTRMIGDQHIYNCLSAAAVALVMGVELTEIAAGLEAVETLPGRMERIECGQPFSVFVDNATTPDALAGTLKTLRKVTTGRLICVHGFEESESAEQRPLLGRVLERSTDLGILTGSLEAKAPLKLLHDVLDGYGHPAAGHVMPDREKAIAWALDQAQAGDTVVITGPYGQYIDADGDVTSESELAREWLYEVAAHRDYDEPPLRPVRNGRRAS